MKTELSLQYKAESKLQKNLRDKIKSTILAKEA